MSDSNRCANCHRPEDSRHPMTMLRMPAWRCFACVVARRKDAKPMRRERGRSWEVWRLCRDPIVRNGPTYILGSRYGDTHHGLWIGRHPRRWHWSIYHVASGVRLEGFADSFDAAYEAMKRLVTVLEKENLSWHVDLNAIDMVLNEQPEIRQRIKAALADVRGFHFYAASSRHPSVFIDDDEAPAPVTEPEESTSCRFVTLASLSTTRPVAITRARAWHGARR